MYQGQRGAKFVIDIDEKTYFLFIYLLLVLFHRPFQLVLFAAQQGEESQYKAYADYCDATDSKPDGLIPRWKHYQFQYPVVFRPSAATGAAWG